MNYDKPALLFEQQAQLLLNRGLITDKALLTQRLIMVNYDPQSNWDARLFNSLDEFRDIPIEQMGFPMNWRSMALWR